MLQRAPQNRLSRLAQNRGEVGARVANQPGRLTQHGQQRAVRLNGARELDRLQFAEREIKLRGGAIGRRFVDVVQGRASAAPQNGASRASLARRAYCTRRPISV